MSILELKFNAGKSSGSSADLGEVWDALGSVLDTIDALADKLDSNANLASTNKEELNMLEDYVEPTEEGSGSND